MEFLSLSVPSVEQIKDDNKCFETIFGLRRCPGAMACGTSASAGQETSLDEVRALFLASLVAASSETDSFASSGDQGCGSEGPSCGVPESGNRQCKSSSEWEARIETAATFLAHLAVVGGEKLQKFKFLRWKALTEKEIAEAMRRVSETLVPL